MKAIAWFTLKRSGKKPFSKEMIFLNNIEPVTILGDSQVNIKSIVELTHINECLFCTKPPIWTNLPFL